MVDDTALPLVDFGLPLYVGHARWGGGEPVRSRRHRHPHPELVVASGSATLVLDFVEHRIDGMVAFVVPAGAVHEWRDGDGLELWVVGLQSGAVPVAGELHRLVRAGATPVPVAEQREVEAVLVMAKRRFEEEPDRAQRAAQFIAALVTQLAAWAVPATEPGSDELCAAFDRLVAERPELRRVADAADALGVSPRYLAVRVREGTDRSPKEVIDARSVLEAKRLLAGTTEPASTIARRLGFADASQFGRFFRRETGTTPAWFRRELGSDTMA